MKNPEESIISKMAREEYNVLGVPYRNGAIPKISKDQKLNGVLHSVPASLPIFEFTFHQNYLFLSEILSIHM